MLRKVFRLTPRPLLAAAGLFFVAAYFALRFPDVPGAGAGSYVSTALIALPPTLALFRYLGAGRAGAALLALSAFAYAIEATGVATGLPYGAFYYGDDLGPKAFGLVPYLLPVTYVPLVIGAVAASGGRPVARILGAAGLLTLFDAVLDPGAVVMGFWVWPDGGAYYGVPLSNYAGWLLSGALASALLVAFGRGWRDAPPPGLLDGLILSLAFWSGVAAFSGLAIPALIGAGLLAALLRRRATLRAAHRAAFRDGTRRAV